jgi:hypothetical protein
MPLTALIILLYTTRVSSSSRLMQLSRRGIWPTTYRFMSSSLARTSSTGFKQNLSVISGIKREVNRSYMFVLI